jgi:hypothetical protein
MSALKLPGWRFVGRSYFEDLVVLSPSAQRSCPSTSSFFKPRNHSTTSGVNRTFLKSSQFQSGANIGLVPRMLESAILSSKKSYKKATARV